MVDIPLTLNCGFITTTAVISRGDNLLNLAIFIELLYGRVRLGERVDDGIEMRLLVAITIMAKRDGGLSIAVKPTTSL